MWSLSAGVSRCCAEGSSFTCWRHWASRAAPSSRMSRASLCRCSLIFYYVGGSQFSKLSPARTEHDVSQRVNVKIFESVWSRSVATSWGSVHGSRIQQFGRAKTDLRRTAAAHRPVNLAGCIARVTRRELHIDRSQLGRLPGPAHGRLTAELF